MPPEDVTENAMKAAWNEFARMGESTYFSAPRANRFFVQPLNDGTATIVVGSAGTVTRENGDVAPVAAVLGAVNVDRAFLQNLRRVIDAFYPETDAAS